MSEWRMTTVGDVALQVTKGTTPASSDFTSAGVAYVKVEAIRDDGAIDHKRLSFVHERVHATVLKRSRLQPNDLLFTIAGTIGKAAIVQGSMLPANVNQAVAIIRPDVTRIIPRFLYYALRDRNRLQSAVARTVQSVQSNLSLSELSQLQVPQPPPAEQQAIAEVLGALDDKIAANAVLAATAAESARLEHAAVAKEGSTQTRKFADIALISGGGTPSTKVRENWDGEIWWATPTDVTALEGPYLEQTSRTLTQQGLASCSSKLFQPGAVLMTSRATIGALAVNDVATAVNQGFIVVEPFEPELRWWLYQEMQSRIEEFISWANGATFLELSRGTFKRLHVRMPAPELVAAVTERLGVLHAVGRAHLRENRTLAATRDALLPQLMSGKLRVRDAEKIAAEAGA